MKKVLSAVLAGAMMAAMAVPAFAASKPAEAGHVYDSDGEDISSNSDDDVYGKADFSFLKNGGRSINIDGVVPGITMYIPLGAGVGDVISGGTTTGETPDPQAAHYYNAKKDVMKPLYDTAKEDEEKTNKDTAFASITSTALADWDAVTAGHTADSSAKFYYAAQSGANTLTEVADFTEAPTGTNYYFDADAKNAYDAKLDTEDNDDEANILNASAIKGKEVSGTDVWKNADVKSYYKSGSFTDFTYSAGTPSTDSYKISLSSLTNEDYFKFDVDKDDNGSMVKKVEVVEDKKLGDMARTAYLKIDLNDSTTVNDIKSNGTLTFKAKDSAADFQKASGSKKLNDTTQVWDEKEEIKIDYTFWINNDKASNDDNPDSGDRVYFDPDDNEDNTLIWGDDRAGLFFEANDDASKFYARLSTKSDSEVYSEYGDPVNADLWFFDFVGSSTIPATSRATLTLGIPWDEDDDYTPNPEDCFIYEKQEDGNYKHLWILYSEYIQQKRVKTRNPRLVINSCHRFGTAFGLLPENEAN